jgi:Domain of unknown function (DUF892)
MRVLRDRTGERRSGDHDHKGSPAGGCGPSRRRPGGVEHYEISRYGTLRTWANELGHADAVKLLDATLQEERKH